MTDWTDPYIAGFFDGEGSIMILRRPNRHYELATKITQVDPKPLCIMQSRFGGSLGIKKPTGTAHRPASQLQLASRASYEMLKALRPYLVVKDLEADVAIAFYESDRSKGEAYLSLLHEMRS